jgi:putative membrane protein
MSALLLAFRDSYAKTFPVFLVWLFHLSALVGITLGYFEWFITKTPLNLLSLGLIMLVYFPLYSAKSIKIFVLCFIVGLTVEWVGVHTGVLFGDYSYGDNLGWKISGVPLLIGMNWAILVFTTAIVAQKITKNRWLAMVLGAFLMMSLDILLEFSAPSLSFWSFEGGSAPLKNYIDWFWISFILHYVVQRWKLEGDFRLSANLYAAQFVFFMFFLIQ